MKRFAFALALFAAPAQAALPPCAIDTMMREARYVVLIGDTTVSPPDVDGYCRVDGTVVRQYSSPHPPGKRVATYFPCENPRGIVGGLIYSDASWVAAAPFVEIHIAPEGGVAGNGQGIFARETVTDAPQWEPDAMCG